MSVITGIGKFASKISKFFRQEFFISTVWEYWAHISHSREFLGSENHIPSISNVFFWFSMFSELFGGSESGFCLPSVPMPDTSVLPRVLAAYWYKVCWIGSECSGTWYDHIRSLSVTMATIELAVFVLEQIGWSRVHDPSLYRDLGSPFEYFFALRIIKMLLS